MCSEESFDTTFNMGYGPLEISIRKRKIAPKKCVHVALCVNLIVNLAHRNSEMIISSYNVM